MREIQPSLFDDLFPPETKKEINQFFFVSLGLSKEILKYGKDEKMGLTNKYENREDVIKILMNDNFTRTEAELLTEKAYANPDSWYEWKEEQCYIF